MAEMKNINLHSGTIRVGGSGVRRRLRRPKRRIRRLNHSPQIANGARVQVNLLHKYGNAAEKAVRKASNQADRRRWRELEWIRRHQAEYPGKWVALEGDQLVAIGNGAREVREAALAKGFALPLLVHVPDEPDLPFGGW